MEILNGCSRRVPKIRIQPCYWEPLPFFNQIWINVGSMCKWTFEQKLWRCSCFWALNVSFFHMMSWIAILVLSFSFCLTRPCSVVQFSLQEVHSKITEWFKTVLHQGKYSLDITVSPSHYPLMFLSSVHLFPFFGSLSWRGVLGPLLMSCMEAWGK